MKNPEGGEPLKIELSMPSGLEEQIKSVVIQATNQAINEYYGKQATKEWMSVKEACSYIGVSYNTLSKYRQMGLRICEIDGVKRISKKEIDNFLEKHSF